MKRTNMLQYVADRGRYNEVAVHRRVMEDNGRFYIKWNGKTLDITEDVKTGNRIIRYSGRYC